MILRSKFEEGKDLSSQHSLRPGTLPLYKLVFVGGPVLPRLMTSSEIREGNGSPWGCLLEGQEVVAQETAGRQCWNQLPLSTWTQDTEITAGMLRFVAAVSQTLLL